MKIERKTPYLLPTLVFTKRVYLSKNSTSLLKDAPNYHHAKLHILSVVPAGPTENVTQEPYQEKNDPKIVLFGKAFTVIYKQTIIGLDRFYTKILPVTYNSSGIKMAQLYSRISTQKSFTQARIQL